MDLKKLMEGSDPSCSNPAKSKTTNREHYDKIRRSSPGEAHVMGIDLSKFERRLAHERATELGTEHHSEGVDRVVPGTSTVLGSVGPPWAA